jgi:hypothetical protein
MYSAVLELSHVVQTERKAEDDAILLHALRGRLRAYKYRRMVLCS